MSKITDEIKEKLDDITEIENAIEEDDERAANNFAKKLPDPAGYRLLVAPVKTSDTTEGGILLPDSVIAAENMASIVSYVLKVGPDAYKDESKFPTGPWCGEGDFVITRSYSGTKLNVMGHELRIINDDSVEGVAEDPRGITRA